MSEDEEDDEMFEDAYDELSSAEGKDLQEGGGFRGW